MSFGSRLAAALIAAETSRAASSMLRVNSNCTRIVVCPSVLIEVNSLIPEIWPSWRSSGRATALAIVSGLAPGSAASTRIVGRSIAGSAAMPSWRKAANPAMRTAAIKSEVAIGRRMNGAEITAAGAGQRG